MLTPAGAKAVVILRVPNQGDPGTSVQVSWQRVKIADENSHLVREAAATSPVELVTAAP
jgi:hypothetical protein